MSIHKSARKLTAPVWMLVATGCVLGVVMIGWIVQSVISTSAMSRKTEAMQDAWREYSRASETHEARTFENIYNMILLQEGEYEITVDNEGVERSRLLVHTDPVVVDGVSRMRMVHMKIEDVERESMGWHFDRRLLDAKFSAQIQQIDAASLALRNELSSISGRWKLDAMLNPEKGGTDSVARRQRAIAAAQAEFLDMSVQLQMLQTLASQDAIWDVTANRLIPSIDRLSSNVREVAASDGESTKLVKQMDELAVAVLGRAAAKDKSMRDPGKMAGSILEMLIAKIGSEHARNGIQIRVRELEIAATRTRSDTAAIVSKRASAMNDEIAAMNRGTLKRAVLLAGASSVIMVVLGFRVAGSIRKTVASLETTSEELRDRDRKLEQSNRLEAIGQLAAGIAHEINTPIQYAGDNVRYVREQFELIMEVIGVYACMLNRSSCSMTWEERSAKLSAKLDEIDFEFVRVEVPKALDAALEGLGRVANIVRAMKDFSHPGSTTKQRADINRCIESTVMVCKNRWKYAAELTMKLDTGIPPTMCMVAELNQVILNMVVNAADAIVEKFGEGNKGEIKVSTKQSGNWVEIEIQDNGAGIPDAVVAKIYDPFFTTKGVGKGTGQGLAISRDIVVNKHGGTIDCVSRAGEGTRFMIRLPTDASEQVGVVDRRAAA